MFKSQKCRLQYTEEGKAEFTFTTQLSHSQAQKQAQEIKDILFNGKELTIEVKQHRERRSLDSNSYLWVMVTKIADVMSKDKGRIYTKEEIYIEMLKRYGQSEKQLISVVSEAADMIYRATNNHCVEVGTGEANGKQFTHFRILIGSSQYDTQSMAKLINGVVQDAQELGIDTLTPNEIAKMNALWGV